MRSAADSLPKAQPKVLCRVTLAEAFRDRLFPTDDQRIVELPSRNQTVWQVTEAAKQVFHMEVPATLLDRHGRPFREEEDRTGSK